MSFKPYTDLIPSNIKWFKDLADFGKGGLITIPGNPNQRYRPWMDQSAANYTKDFFSGFYSNSTKSRTYNIIKRDLNGAPQLTPINSPEFYETYASGDSQNPPNINAYRQYSYMFSAGVPFTQKVTLAYDQNKLDEPNFTGFKVNGVGWDYPVFVKPTDMLVVVNGEVQTIDVYDFLKMVSVRDVSFEEKLELVSNLLDRNDMTAKDKCSAIHEVTTIANIVYPVV